MTIQAQSTPTAATLWRRGALLTFGAALSLCTVGNAGCQIFFPLNEKVASEKNALEARITATGRVQGQDEELVKSFRVCMPEDLNPNQNGGIEPTHAQLTDYCNAVLLPIAKQMLQECAAQELKNFTYLCDVTPATFLDVACEETCNIVTLNSDCSNLDTATAVFGLAEAACLAEQDPQADGPRPIGGGMAKRSTVEATAALGSTVTIVRGGSAQTQPADGHIELTGDLFPGSPISFLTALSHVDDFHFDALGGLADATLTNVFAASSNTATAVLGDSGQAVFGPSTTLTTGGGKLRIPISPDDSAQFAVGNAEDVVATIDLANKLCTLDSTAVGDDDGTTVEVITHLVGTLVNQPPQADAGADEVVECTSADGASFVLDCGGSTDPDGNIVAHQWRVASRTGDELGIFDSMVTTSLALDATEEYYCNVVDAFAQMATDSKHVTVADSTAPTISCNAPATILPSQAPISFMANAEDTCDPTAGGTVSVIGFDCFLEHKGKFIKKTESCVVGVDGATFTILDSGGVKTKITWTVTASDSSGNIGVQECGVIIAKPGA